MRVYAKNTDGVAYSDEVSFSTLDEKTFTGDVELVTQQELDSFATQHYQRIKGSLRISGTVTDLTLLSDLVVVTKELNISFTDHLTSLYGLHNLKSVNAEKTENAFIIEFNQELKNLKGLENITSFYGTLRLWDDYELTSLEGLDNLKTLGSGALIIDNCDKLANLHGLENLEVADVYIHIRYNEMLTDVSALAKLSVTKGMEFTQNTHLQQITGLQSLKTMESLVLFYNPGLKDISGMGHVEQIDLLQIDSNQITTLGGLENVRSIKRILIDHSATLTDLSALGALQTLDYLQLWATGVKNLKGLEGVTSAIAIEIYNNLELQSLDGLDHLQKVESKLAVVNNPKLNSLQTLSSFTDVHGTVYFENNTSLSDFCPLKPAMQNAFSVNFTAQGNAANPTMNEVFTNCP